MDARFFHWMQNLPLRPDLLPMLYEMYQAEREAAIHKQTHRTALRMDVRRIPNHYTERKPVDLGDVVLTRDSLETDDFLNWLEE